MKVSTFIAISLTLCWGVDSQELPGCGGVQCSESPNTRSCKELPKEENKCCRAFDCVDDNGGNYIYYGYSTPKGSSSSISYRSPDSRSVYSSSSFSSYSSTRYNKLQDPSKALLENSIAKANSFPFKFPAPLPPLQPINFNSIADPSPYLPYYPWFPSSNGVALTSSHRSKGNKRPSAYYSGSNPFKTQFGSPSAFFFPPSFAFPPLQFPPSSER